MESEAAFKERAAVIGVPSAQIAKLQAKGVATFGAFAFLSSFQPGGTDETPFVRALATTLDVREADIVTSDLVAFRRLYYESHTLALGDLRSRMERKDDDTPRRLPMAERAERLTSLKGELTGLTIDAQLEPAHRLVDNAIQQAEDNTLRYIALKERLSRESEIMHQKHESAIDFTPDGTMKLSKKQKELYTDVTRDLKVRMAMQRRALAYHMAGICSYQVLDEIATRMFALLTKEPLAGFRAIGLQQIIMADREMWLQAAQNIRGKNLTDVTKPLDDVMKALQDSSEVRFHLLPVQSHAAPKKGDKDDEGPPIKKRRTDDKKGKGKGKANIKLPENCVASTSAGQRLCFQYNRGRCNNQNKDKCARGLHLCWKQGCHGKHPHTECKQ